MEFKIEKVLEALEERGVSKKDLIDLIYFIQYDHSPKMDNQQVDDALMNVLKKVEVQLAIYTGIELDRQIEEKRFYNKELEDIIEKDYGIYGIDEVMAFSICNLYGAMALTNFGYIDNKKIGIIKKLDENKDKCHTFLDDILGAIAACAASRIAYHYGKRELKKDE